jgi:hypothetical protein
MFAPDQRRAAAEIARVLRPLEAELMDVHSSFNTADQGWVSSFEFLVISGTKA